MRAQKHFFRRITSTIVGVWLLGGAASILTAVPVLTIDPDPTGQKITWDGTEGRDYVLQGSDDMVTWTDMGLSVIQTGAGFAGQGTNAVLVPTSMTRKMYRLLNDGNPATKEPAYVGADTCKLCHSGKYAQWIDTGHPYKLNKIVDGQPPTYFSTNDVNVPNPPIGVSWNDVGWVIGGAAWKARFIGHDGYIITSTPDAPDPNGNLVQYNLQDGSWATYHTGEQKPYDCGKCHTTGWVHIDDGSVHQDAAPGMFGSYASSAIECEACHGPGSRHVDAPFAEKTSEIILDTSSAMCGRCHVRGDDPSVNLTIPASNGFIRHHEQYNEMLSAGHAGHDCVTCHNPHKSVKIGAKDGIIASCTDCHNNTTPAVGTTSWDYTDQLHGNDGTAVCIDCHMPRASKSAIKLNKYTGDLHTHIFKINPAADGVMFEPDGKFVKLDPVTGSPGVTLGFVCYKCHTDPDGIGDSAGAGAPQMTLQDLSGEATNYHGLPTP